VVVSGNVDRIKIHEERIVDGPHGVFEIYVAIIVAAEHRDEVNLPKSGLGKASDHLEPLLWRDLGFDGHLRTTKRG
jgi:hypothetical protein